MPNVIQIKRAALNGTSSVPTGLASGEMALDQAGRKLYIGRHNNSSVQIAHLPTLDDITAGDGITMSAASSESARGRTLSLTLTDANIFATANAKGIASFSTDNFLVSSGVVTIKDDGVILATETTGNFVQALVAGTGVTVTNNTGENTTPTVAIGQAVETSSNPQFAGVTADAITIGVAAAGTITTASGDLTLNSNGGDVIIAGNLQVDGTTTTVNSTVVTVDDPIFRLGGDGNASDDNKDKGIAFAWHNGSAAKVGFFGFDESDSTFTFIPDSTESGFQIMSGTVGNAKFTALTLAGALDGATINGGTF
jgi:hypothetical protein